MEDQIEKLQDKFNDKHEMIQLNIFSSNARIDALEKKTCWIEDEIIRGRETIAAEFKVIRTKLDLLHDDKIKRDGYEQSQKDSDTWKRWFWPLLISMMSVGLAALSIFLNS